jgi:riboflavin kinase/FMN adenylyltransferase
MKLIRHPTRAAWTNRPRVVSVGWFDGVHLGHQRVLARCVAEAARLGGEALVVVRRGSRTASALTGLRDQLALFGSAGIERIVIAETAAGRDVALATACNASLLVSGRTVSLREAPGRLAIEYVSGVDVDGQRVDADAIRAALAQGDLTFAARRLGRDHLVSGRVIHGHHRGRPLGIPTANIRLRGIQLPPDGVYAVRARLDDREWRGVANIGFNPTFGNRARSVETHLLDFDGDLYGRRLAIAFVAHLRGERKFDSVDALVAQIRADITAARRLFGP